MYRSKYPFKPGDSHHEILDTVESTIQRHYEKPEPDRSVLIPYAVRNQHVYVPGKTRHGKSTLFHSMALQDIENGAGVCVIDPKGDLVNSLIHHVPESRKDDCVYLSTHDPVPINFMDYANDDEKETLVGELKYVITRGMGAEQAPLMDAIMTDLLYTLLNANENEKFPVGEHATFLDIHRFLSDGKRRERILEFVTDRELKKRWTENFPHPKECAPTITRMTPFVRNPSLRKLFDCPDPRLNVAEFMDNRKIILVNLGGVSESTKIFATLLIAKMRQVAFRRHNIPEGQRIPFFVYVDEFEFFQTSDFDQILSFAGGYGLRLTLANQFIGQLDGNIRQSIFGNVGSFIVFCVSPDDARYFKHIPGGERVAILPKYHALFKVAGEEPIVKATPPPAPFAKNSQADHIRNRTRDLYARDPIETDYAQGDDPMPEPGPTEDPEKTERAKTPPPSSRGADEKPPPTIAKPKRKEK